MSSSQGSSSSQRFSASGRRVEPQYYQPWYVSDAGRETPEGQAWILDELTQTAERLGFNSIFDAIPFFANSSNPRAQRQLVDFAKDGTNLTCLLKVACRKNLQSSLPDPEREQYKSTLCEAGRAVYLQEWGDLTHDDTIRVPMHAFSLQHVESLSIEPTYARWRVQAPSLFRLFEGMGNGSAMVNQPERSSPRLNEERRRQIRHILMSLSIMGNLRSRQINLIQGLLSYYMYVGRLSKRVMTVLNHWGILVSSTSVHTAVSTIGAALRSELQSVGRKGNAFFVVFDNCTASATVRDERLHNKSDFLKYTVGYILEPSIGRPMFLRTDVNYRNVTSLTIRDFIPPADDTKLLKSIFGHFIANAVSKYCKQRRISLAKLDFPLPAVDTIDPKLKPKVHVLPTYDLDESLIDDMIEILYRIARDVGLSEAQIMENIVPYGGDYFTTITERRAKARQVECSPNKQLNYIEATIGLFHLEIAVLVMLFRSHGGSEKDHGTIYYWIKTLQRNRNSLWDGGKQLVKDFRACYELFGQILDGYLVGFITERCGWTAGEIKPVLDKATDVEAQIATLAAELVDFGQTSQRRQQTDARDRQHENMFLFLQHGLILRNFHQAMRNGDIGRLLISFRHMTCWFQGTNQFNYSQETIHLTACLSAIWSPGFKEFMLKNCLVSISGKRDGFYALDELNEYVVREVKNMMVHNATPKTDEHLREVISLQIMFFMRLKMKMAEESDATFVFDYHHQDVDTSADVDSVAKNCLSRKVFTRTSGRDVDKKEVPDLLMNGIGELSRTTRLMEYKAKVAAMGIRGVVELQNQAEGATQHQEQEGELEEGDDGEIPIEIELLGGATEDPEESWLDE